MSSLNHYLEKDRVYYVVVTPILVRLLFGEMSICKNNIIIATDTNFYEIEIICAIKNMSGRG